MTRAVCVLQERRDGFLEDLDIWAKQSEEYCTYGDVSKIRLYLERAQDLDNKLQAAADTVSYCLPHSIYKLILKDSI